MVHRIVESYLSLLRETCAADAVHLRMTCDAGGEPMTLFDQCCRSSLRYGIPTAAPPRQMAFALVSEGAPVRSARGGKDFQRGWDSRGREDIEGDEDFPDDQRDAAVQWANPLLCEVAGSVWNLTFQFETQEWRFLSVLRGIAVELRLALAGGEIRRRLDLVWPFLAFLGNFLAYGDLGSASVPEREAGAGTPFDPPLVGASTAVLDLRRRIRSLAGATVPVLIDGESGTGKEIVARNLHRLGGRSQKPLVIVNCMELPETLLQSELFGHLKGAFTGAVKDRMGLVESANGGTLFLDEIGEMPLTQQAALLRVLQEHEVRRIGDSARRTVDVRFVFATNRDLAECVRRGRFREDLYFRVSAVRLSLPPLRRRREDIPMLVGHFLEQHAASGGSITGVSPAALCRMLSYAWPGNVRELRNEIERAVALNRDARIITLDMLSPAVREAAPAVGTGGVAAHETLRTAVEGVERRMISEALECSEGNRTRAAAVLGVSRQGLLKKMRRYGMR